MSLGRWAWSWARALLDRFISFTLRGLPRASRASAPDPAEAIQPATDMAPRAASTGCRWVSCWSWCRSRFWTAATLLAGLVPVPLTRLAIGIVVNAYIGARVMLAIGRMLLAPDTSGLRLLRINDDRAAYLMRWLRRLALVAAIGGAAAGLTLLFGLHPAAYATLIQVIGFVVAVLLGVIVMQLRASVATHLRAAPEGKSAAAWRDWLAAVWRCAALLAIAVGWITWAAGFETGAGGIWMLLGTVLIAVGGRLVALIVVGLLDRVTEPRPEAAAAFGLLVGAASRAPLDGDCAAVRAFRDRNSGRPPAPTILGRSGRSTGWRLARSGAYRGALVTIGLAVLAAVIVWELADIAVERRLARLREAGTPAHAARLRTLLRCYAPRCSSRSSPSSG